jgi:hypothetical protein
MCYILPISLWGFKWGILKGNQKTRFGRGVWQFLGGGLTGFPDDDVVGIRWPNSSRPTGGGGVGWKGGMKGFKGLEPLLKTSPFRGSGSEEDFRALFTRLANMCRTDDPPAQHMSFRTSILIRLHTPQLQGTCCNLHYYSRLIVFSLGVLYCSKSNPLPSHAWKAYLRNIGNPFSRQRTMLQNRRFSRPKIFDPFIGF